MYETSSSTVSARLRLKEVEWKFQLKFVRAQQSRLQYSQLDQLDVLWLALLQNVFFFHQLPQSAVFFVQQRINVRRIRISCVPEHLFLCYRQLIHCNETEWDETLNCCSTILFFLVQVDLEKENEVFFLFCSGRKFCCYCKLRDFRHQTSLNFSRVEQSLRWRQRVDDEIREIGSLWCRTNAKLRLFLSFFGCQSLFFCVSSQAAREKKLITQQLMWMTASYLVIITVAFTWSHWDIWKCEKCSAEIYGEWSFVFLSIKIVFLSNIFFSASFSGV